MTLAIVVGWIVCGAVAYGGWFACVQGRWSKTAHITREADKLGALVAAALGPLGLVAVAYLTRFEYGLRFR